METKSSKKQNSLEKLAIVVGKVEYENGGALPEAKVILIDDSGKPIVIFIDDYGHYRFDAAAGNYSVEFISDVEGLAPRKIENYKFETGYRKLDIVLDIFKKINTIEVDTDRINNR